MEISSGFPKGDQIVRGVCIADLHFGMRRTEEMYQNELPAFLDFIKTHDLDIINIDGDYFDRQLVLTEQAAKYAMHFFGELAMICKERHIRLRVIKGTESHERSQLDNFTSYLLDKDLDLRIFSTVAEEDILGMHVLYVPEEYPKDAKAYYAPYMAKKWNMAHTHGTWSFVAFASQKKESARTDITSAPVFDYDDWKGAFENGVILSGHIHGRNIYSIRNADGESEGKIFYFGSFSRWNFDELSARGFGYYEYDVTQQRYFVEPIDNMIAPKYGDFDASILGKDPEKAELGAVEAAVSESMKSFDYLRVDLGSLSPVQGEFLKKKFAGDKRIQLEYRTKKAIMIQEDEEYKTYVDKFSYIKDQSAGIEKTVCRFIKDTQDIDIAEDRVKELIAPEEGA